MSHDGGPRPYRLVLPTAMAMNYAAKVARRVKRKASRVILLALCAGCATTVPVRLDQGRVQAPLADLERYVLEDARQFKRLLDERGALYEDPTLQAYLASLCRPLFPPVDPALPYRFDVKVLRDPTLNAFAFSDGAIYVNTGLVARLSSAEELAFVVSHEVSHVMNRDLLYFTDTLRRKTVAAKLTGLVVTPALAAIGLGGLGESGVGLAYAASLAGYGRERETRADEEGARRLKQLGYDPQAALRAMRATLDEEAWYQRGWEVSFLSDHPSTAARFNRIRELLGLAPSAGRASAADATFEAATEQLRLDNASLNIQLGRPYHAVDELQRLHQRQPDHAPIQYLLAEAYRALAEDPGKLKEELTITRWTMLREAADITQTTYWQSQAAAAYTRVLTTHPAFPASYRGLGLLRHAQGQSVEAGRLLRRYLDLAPAASDRRFVISYIAKLEQPPQ